MELELTSFVPSFTTSTARPTSGISTTTQNQISNQKWCFQPSMIFYELSAALKLDFFSVEVQTLGRQ